MWVEEIKFLESSTITACFVLESDSSLLHNSEPLETVGVVVVEEVERGEGSDLYAIVSIEEYTTKAFNSRFFNDRSEVDTNNKVEETTL